MEGKTTLPQSLSDSNLIKAVKLRGLIGEDVIKPSSAKPLIHHLKKLHMHTVQLCSTKGYHAQFRRILEHVLLDEAVWKALQEAKALNWCKEVRRHFPLKISGEGNSLLHSISLYMWGVQDTDLVLQKTFHEALTKTHNINFKLRWQTEYRKVQGFPDPALLHESRIWDQEWQNVIESADPRSPAGQALTNIYQDIHIFVLANIVRRPIVVVVGNSEESSKSTSNIMTSSPAGIYLPLHWPPLQCYTCPILLSYEHQYFTPLISVNDVGPELNAFPLVVPSENGSVELPIRFLLNTEKADRKQLLSSYLIQISVPDYNGAEFVNAARLLINPLPNDLNLVQDYFQLVNHQYKFWQENTEKGRSNRDKEEFASLSNLSIMEDKCLTHGCPYFCSKFTKPFCHTCYDAFQRKEVSSGTNIGKRSGNQRSDGHLKESHSEGATIFGLEDIRNTQSTLPSSPSHIPFFSETNALKCKASQCPFTGSVAQNGLCPSCFRENNHLEQIPEGGRNSDPRFPKSSGELVEERIDLWGERCSKCKQEIRKFNGLCFSCLKRMDSLAQTHDPAGGISSELLQVALTNIGSHGPAVDQDQRQQLNQIRETGNCINPNCQYFGTEEQCGFCTTCFFKYVEDVGASSQQDPNRQHSNQFPPHGQLAQISSRLRNMSVCYTVGCSMLANPVYSGYCEKCYVYTQSKHSQTSKSVSEVPADQHVWSSALPRCHNHNQGLSERATNEQLGSELRKSGNNVSGHLQSSQTRTLSSSDQLNPELERNLCRTQGCEHFGNAKCDGYCNACFTASQMHRK
ncbi:tumor necrosis factor alpha-induced protein 3-like [Heptranchias perlo]|uniref:tumor necrosis factor alpha-induced protein 3-like n=1 Tax=Heptranchias perlo TaxID=212740 RepID=UPI0035597160